MAEGLAAVAWRSGHVAGLFSKGSECFTGAKVALPSPPAASASVCDGMAPADGLDDATLASAAATVTLVEAQTRRPRAVMR